MTLLGKIFTVLIFIQSLVFMSFAVAVYATHKNWRDVVLRERDDVKQGEELGLKFQLEDARKRFDQKNAEKIKVENQLAMEKAARRQALATLEARDRQLRERLAATEERNAQLVQSERLAVAALDANERNVISIKDEVVGLGSDSHGGVGPRFTIPASRRADGPGSRSQNGSRPLGRATRSAFR